MSAIESDGGLLRVPAAAAFLGVSRSKVYLMMDSGELRYVKFGKCRRIPRAELLILIERNMVSRAEHGGE